MYRIPCPTIHDYNHAHMKDENICYKIGMAN